jgi:signal peptidase I
MLSRFEDNKEIAMNEEKKNRRTLSGIFFEFLAGRLEATEKGRKIVSHVTHRLNIYSQAWSLSLTVAFVILLRCTVVTAFYIPSPSMEDTLAINDRVFVNRLAYVFGEPQIGDIVVFKVPETIPNFDPDKPIWIKRIVGLEGDTVSIDHEHLMIDGKEVTDPPFVRKNRYFPRSLGGAYEPTHIPDEHVMVFGDNSGNSYDSRYWGPIPEDRIIGKAFVRFWPLSRIGPLHGESKSPHPPGS